MVAKHANSLQTSSFAADAPWDNLQLYKKLLYYKSVNALVSKNAAGAFKLHPWHLTKEMVQQERQRAFADKLLAVRPTTD